MQAKTVDFTTDLQELAQFAKLFSHPARIAIVKLLAEKKNCISGDIANELPLSRTTVCQHLQELKNSGLIKGEISGLNVNYCLDNKKWKDIKSKFEAFLNISVPHFECNC